MDLVRVRAYLEAREGKRFQTREDGRLRALEMARAAIQTVLPAFPRVRRAFLFGSITRPGAMRRDSDIDIAVEGGLSAEEYFALWRDLDRRISGNLCLPRPLSRFALERGTADCHRLLSA